MNDIAFRAFRFCIAAVAVGAGLGANEDTLSTAAHSQQSDQQASAQVTIRSASGVSQQAVVMGASVGSRNGGVTIVYYGEDEAILDEIIKAANYARNIMEHSVNFVIWADPKQEVWSGEYLIVPSHQLEIYTDGMKTATVNYPGMNIAQDLKRIIPDGIEKMRIVSGSETE